MKLHLLALGSEYEPILMVRCIYYEYSNIIECVNSWESNAGSILPFYFN